MNELVTAMLTFGGAVDDMSIWAYIILGLAGLMVLLGIIFRVRNMYLGLGITAIVSQLLLPEFNVYLVGEGFSGTYIGEDLILFSTFIIACVAIVYAIISLIASGVSRKAKKSIEVEEICDDEIIEAEEIDCADNKEESEPYNEDVVMKSSLTDLDILLGRVYAEVNENTSLSEIKKIANELGTHRTSEAVSIENSKIDKCVIFLASIIENANR